MSAASRVPSAPPTETNINTAHITADSRDGLTTRDGETNRLAPIGSNRHSTVRYQLPAPRTEHLLTAIQVNVNIRAAHHHK